MCSYKDRWAVAVGELLKCSRELTNASTRYAVALIKEGMTISHLLHKILRGTLCFHEKQQCNKRQSDRNKMFFG